MSEAGGRVSGLARGDATEDRGGRSGWAGAPCGRKCRARSGQSVDLVATGAVPMRLRSAAVSRALETCCIQRPTLAARRKVSVIVGDRFVLSWSRSTPASRWSAGMRRCSPSPGSDGARSEQGRRGGAGSLIAADVARSHGGALRPVKARRQGLRAELSLARQDQRGAATFSTHAGRVFRRHSPPGLGHLGEDAGVGGWSSSSIEPRRSGSPGGSRPGVSAATEGQPPAFSRPERLLPLLDVVDRLPGGYVACVVLGDGADTADRQGGQPFARDCIDPRQQEGLQYWTRA